MEKESLGKVPVKEEIFDELETDADKQVKKTIFKNGKNEPTTTKPAENLAKAEEKADESANADDLFDHSEENRITKNYGKAAGRLARKFKNIDDDED